MKIELYPEIKTEKELDDLLVVLRGIKLGLSRTEREAIEKIINIFEKGLSDD